MIIAIIAGVWLAAAVVAFSLARVSALADADVRRLMAAYVRTQDRPADAPLRDAA